MRKNLGAKPLMYPQPVLIIATYDQEGKADAMNAAWGGIADYKQVALYLSKGHKTMQNILERGAFTVSMADAKHVIEADYFGVVSANKNPDKFVKSGLHVSKSELVDAPMIDELPLTMECKMITYDEDSELLLGEIVNVSADENILDEDGKIDLDKFHPICFDPMNSVYVTLGKKVGNAFKDGLKLK